MKHDADVIKAANESVKHALGPYYKTSDLVGSLYIIGEGNDIDIIALVSDKTEARCAARVNGFRYTGEDSGEEDDFDTFRKGDINLMITENSEFHANFLQASEVCRFLFEQCGISDRATRVAVHRIIMHEESVEDVRARMQS